jgi:hypothetical protein
MAHEGVPLIVKIIDAVHARPTPMVSASASLRH